MFPPLKKLNWDFFFFLYHEVKIGTDFENYPCTDDQNIEKLVQCNCPCSDEDFGCDCLNTFSLELAYIVTIDSLKTCAKMKRGFSDELVTGVVYF